MITRMWTVALATIVFSSSSLIHAASIDLNGLTYAIGNGFTGDQTHPAGTHFHSSNQTDLPPENPIIPVLGAAEVGGFFGDEEIRGLSEFNLIGQTESDQAILSFDVFNVAEAGLSPEPIGGIFGQEAYDGTFDVIAYGANFFEDVEDYEASPLLAEPLMTLDASTLQPDDSVSLDITSVYNDLVRDLIDDPINAHTALGIRLQMSPPASPDAGAITFDGFRVQVTVIPEPLSMLLLLSGLLTLFTTRTRRQSR